MSDIFSNDYKQNSGGVYLRTPQGSTQIVEVDTTEEDPDTGQPVTRSLSFVIISNVPVTSITRIS